MALTKHQKLAKQIKLLLEALEDHFQKTAVILNALQFHFYETHLIIGRPLMSEKKLQLMMRVHKCGMAQLSSKQELREAAENVPLIGFVLTPRFYPRSNVLVMPPDAEQNEKLAIPWGVKTVLPADNLQKLEEAKQEAFLYCASKDEMSEWIDWFENEDKAASLTNQLLVRELDLQGQITFKKNVLRPARPFYKEAILEYYKNSQAQRISRTLLNVDFAPNEDSDIDAAYRLVSEALSNHQKRHFEDFQMFWRNRLVKLMFEGIAWKEDHIQAFLTEYFSVNNTCKIHPEGRWETGHSVDRQIYGAFIRHFSNCFIADPMKHKADGEIALLLWIMIYVARDLEKTIPIKKLLALTTECVSGRYLTVEGREVELSCGLADILKEYVGCGSRQRKQKLFPNLTIDRLEDKFRRASELILPPSAMPALPEAFLIFPHIESNCRIQASIRRQQLKNPTKILHDPISLKELKRQLVEKSPSFSA